MYQLVFFYEEPFYLVFEDEKEAIAEYKASWRSSEVIVELWWDTWRYNSLSSRWEQMV